MSDLPLSQKMYLYMRRNMCRASGVCVSPAAHYSRPTATRYLVSHLADRRWQIELFRAHLSAGGRGESDLHCAGVMHGCRGAKGRGVILTMTRLRGASWLRTAAESDCDRGQGERSLSLQDRTYARSSCYCLISTDNPDIAFPVINHCLVPLFKLCYVCLILLHRAKACD